MPWAMETKMGFLWAFLLAAIFIISAWVMTVYQNMLVLIVPVLVYVGFLAWVNRVK